VYFESYRNDGKRAINSLSLLYNYGKHPFDPLSLQKYLLSKVDDVLGVRKIVPGIQIGFKRCKKHTANFVFMLT